jgi:ABC-type antimicrobial peptide transport system permease subunit
MDQYQPAGGSFAVLRMRRDVSAQQELVRKAMQRVMPGQSYVTTKPLGEIVADEQRSWQLGATVFVAFGVLALVIAAVGLYSVIGYNVMQRMHELGVRVALGAQSGDILRLVVGQGLRFAAGGVALGTLLAFGASRWLEPLLFKQSPKDPMVYSVVGGLLLLVALAASAVPAFRASRADPNTALRSE